MFVLSVFFKVRYDVSCFLTALPLMVRQKLLGEHLWTNEEVVKP